MTSSHVPQGASSSPHHQRRPRSRHFYAEALGGEVVLAGAADRARQFVVGRLAAFIQQHGIAVWLRTGRRARAANSPGMYPMRVLSEAAAEVRDVIRAGTPTHGRLRDRLVALALATVGFDIVCAVLAFLFEHHQQQTQIKTLGSALFWTSTQLLTVSSSIQNPISFPARVLDVVMEIYAITVIASLAGALGAFLVKRGEEIDATRQ